MAFVETFGGTTILPANAGYLALNMSEDVSLEWPVETAASANVAADTIDVDASVAGLNIDLADARVVGAGYAILFNNVGGETVSIRNVVGGAILSLASGTAWIVYLASNATAAGAWRVFQLGASVSTAVASALAGAGLKAIATNLNLAIVTSSTAVTPVAPVSDDRAKLINWTGGVGVLNLPAVASVGADWFIYVRNSGSGNFTATPAAGTIDGAATKVLAPDTSAIIVTDGTNWYTIGYGSGTSGGGGFDFLEINAAGSGTITLSGSQLGRKAYRFTGVLTGNRTIVVPGTIEEYWIDNSTSGAFSLYVKTAAQAAPGVEVLQGNRNILYSDGNNVLDAESTTVTFPIAVSQGGTGATTASAARTNLGATTTGAAVFTAADAAAARTAIAAIGSSRAVNTGNGLSGGGDLSADRTLIVNHAHLCAAIRKSAVTSRTATVRSDDPHLVLTVPEAGLYWLEIHLLTTTTASGNALLYNLGGTATIDTSGAFSGVNTLRRVNATTINDDMTWDGHSVPGTQTALTLGTAGNVGYGIISGLVNFSAGGTLTFSWASTSGGNIDLNIGSFMKLQRCG